MELSTPVLMAVLGGLGGAVLGAAARWAGMCTLGAIEDAVLGRDWSRARAWALALAVAVIGTQVAGLAGLVDLHASAYLGPRLGLAGLVLGGLMFGLGMALVGTCSFGMLLRAAAGDLKALVGLLVLAVTGYMTLSGVTGVLRVALIEPIAIDLAGLGGQGLGDLLGGTPAAQALAAGAAGLALLAFAGATGAVWRRPSRVVAAIAIGLVIPFGWIVTGWLGADPFDPQRVQSYSYIRPVGESLLYLMTFSGARLNFGIGAVAGALAGAAAVAVWKGQLRWEAFDDQREMRRHLLGAALMGVGGVMALGCTIGQGLSGMSTLSLGAPITLASIVAGAVLGLHILVAGPLSELSARATAGLRGRVRAVLHALQVLRGGRTPQPRK